MFMMVFRHVLEVVVLCCAIVVRLLYDSCAIVVLLLCDCCTIVVLLCNCCAILVKVGLSRSVSNCRIFLF